MHSAVATTRVIRVVRVMHTYYAQVFCKTLIEYVLRSYKYTRELQYFKFLTKNSRYTITSTVV